MNILKKIKVKKLNHKFVSMIKGIIIETSDHMKASYKPCDYTMEDKVTYVFWNITYTRDDETKDRYYKMYRNASGDAIIIMDVLTDTDIIMINPKRVVWLKESSDFYTRLLYSDIKVNIEGRR